MLTLLLTATMFGTPPDLTQYLTGYVKGEPTKIAVLAVPGKDLRDLEVYLRHDVALAWIDMVEAASRDGVHLVPNFGFRDHKLQKQLRKQSRRLAARPGFSPHEAGIAIDVAGTTKRVRGRRQKTDVYNWLKLNASRWGFHQTIKKEPWHWQWVEHEEDSTVSATAAVSPRFRYHQPSQTLPMSALVCQTMAL